MPANFRYIKILLLKVTLRKIFHAFANFSSYVLSNFFKVAVVWGMPCIVTIEPTNRCNLNCPECPSGNKSMTRKRGDIDKHFFYSLIDQIKKSTSALTLYFQGESYLHPDIFEIATYASSCKIIVNVSTNGHFLEIENAKKTVDSKMDHVIISLDGFSQKDYQKYRIGGDMQKVLNGIKNLRLARTEKKSLRPFITAQVLVLKSNEKHLSEIKRIAIEHGADRVVFKSAQFYDLQNASDLLPENPYWTRYRKDENGNFKIKNKIRNRCKRLWTNPVVTWDGMMIPCCFDKDATFPLADLTKIKSKDAWKSPSFNLFRKQVLHSRKKVQICCNCTE
ncbi:MAG: radical SAM/SPASM domain-containing protein [Bacteroidota bacterium]